MKRFLPALFFIVGVLGLWQVIVMVFAVPEYLVPKPTEIVVRSFLQLPNLLPHLFVTSLESVSGFFLGSFAGIILAILFMRSKIIELGVYPYAIALNSVPVIAIAPLLVVWFGNGLLPKILVAAIISFFPVVVNTTKGLRSIDGEAFDLFHSLSASGRQIFLKLQVPMCLPYLFVGLRISSTLAVIGAIVGEFSGADKGLGFFIVVSSHRLETIDMFVGILISSGLGITFFYLIAFMEKVLIPWKKTAYLNLRNG